VQGYRFVPWKLVDFFFVKIPVFSRVSIAVSVFRLENPIYKETALLESLDFRLVVPVSCDILAA
jgi:hypothetical protein